MAAPREFLGDQVHLLQSDLHTAEAENAQLKQSLSRKEQECENLKEQLSELKDLYDIQFTDAVAIRTILEQTASTLHGGLTRFAGAREMRQAKKEDQEQRRVPPPVVPKAPPREEGSIYKEDPPPLFLRNDVPPPAIKND